MYGVANIIFGEAFEISDLIIRGKLDTFLVQPKNVFLSVLTSKTKISAIGDLIYGYICLAIYGFTIRNLALFTIFSITGALILTAFASIVGSFSFWIVKGDIIADSLNNVMLHFDTYPGTIFKNGVKIILYTILPVGIANYMPLDMIISFNVKKGETLAILGKNGAGKSTLLSLILGLLKSENGDILLLNQKIKSQRQRAQIIGFVPQSEKNIFSFKVTDMILFGLNASISLFSKPSKEDYEKVLKASELAGCSHLLDLNIDEISGGQKQLVLIARALVSNPKLLIMDEPISYLDTAHQNNILGLILKLNEKGISVIFSSHYPDHSLMVAHKALLLLKDSHLFGLAQDILNSENLKELFKIDFIKKEILGQSRILPKWDYALGKNKNMIKHN